MLMSFARTHARTAGLLTLLTLTVTLSAPTPAHAQQVVAPNSLAAANGNLDNRFPFLVNGGIRYQQVYNASQFGGVGAGSQITQIAFRPDAAFAAFSRNLSNVTIQFSTIGAAADSLSGTFASNIGANVTTVYAGSLTLSSAFTGPAGGPKDFDVLINLQTPFTYNPAGGNLLLDVLNASPEANSIGVFLDAEDTTGDSVSRVWGAEGVPGAATGTVDTVGLVTRFTFSQAASSAAPEPASLALLALSGLPVVGAVVRRRRRAA